MLNLDFHKGTKNKVILSLLFLTIVSPVVVFAQPKQGASILTLKKNNLSYEVVPMDRLFFQYQPPMDIENPDGTVTKKSDKPMAIPDNIKEISGKQVAIKGFVLPLDVDGDYVKTFLLVDQLVSCLFCQGMGMDQWVMVTVKDPKGVRIKDEEYESPITVYGTIDIGEKVEGDVVVSIYRMDADGIDVSRKGLFNFL